MLLFSLSSFLPSVAGNLIAEREENAPLVNTLREHKVIVIQDEDMPKDYLMQLAKP